MTPQENLSTSTDQGAATTEAQPEVMLRVTDEPETTEVSGQKSEVSTEAGFPAVQKPETTPPADPAQPAEPQTELDTQPLVDQAPTEVEAKPHDVLSGLFDAYETPEAAVGAAMESLDKTFAYDQGAYYTLANAIYHRHQDWYKERALTDAGIPQEKIGEFADWIQKGGDLPTPVQAQAFPAPDADGYVTLPSGRVIDMSDPADAEAYDAAKFRHDYEQEKAGEASRKQAEEKQRADAAAAGEAKKVQEAQEQRISAFTSERLTFMDNAIAEATKDYGSPLLQGVAYSIVSKLMDFAFDADGPPKMLADVPQFKAAFEHVKQLNALSNRAAPHIVNGDGRAAEIGKAADAITKNLINAALSDFNKLIIRQNQSERAALAGQPRIPGAAPVQAGTPAATNNEKPKTEAEIEKNLQQKIAAQFGG